MEPEPVYTVRGKSWNCTRVRDHRKIRRSIAQNMAGCGNIDHGRFHSGGDEKDGRKKQERQPETATLAGGCFWCLDAVFRKVEGVLAVESGYTGGTDPSPSYRTVCSGATGHAEAVRIRFDPDRISFQRLLDIFFTVHDPTTLNRQGADVGTQYRSEIFWHTPEQEEIARKYIEKLSGTEAVSGRKVVTALTSAGPFYPAEDYHQDYYARNTGQPYCQMVIRPKMEKFQKAFSSRSG
nr:peptide-methionine (S)-S-oxide reductase MsrA [Leptospirillum ferriphilum]